MQLWTHLCLWMEYRGSPCTSLALQVSSRNVEMNAFCAEAAFMKTGYWTSSSLRIMSKSHLVRAGLIGY